jgi:hypothetical protein
LPSVKPTRFEPGSRTPPADNKTGTPPAWGPSTHPESTQAAQPQKPGETSSPAPGKEERDKAYRDRVRDKHSDLGDKTMEDYNTGKKVQEYFGSKTGPKEAELGEKAKETKRKHAKPGDEFDEWDNFDKDRKRDIKGIFGN